MSEIVDHPDPVRRVALVSGGGNGIGRAVCAAFYAIGCIVVIADIDLKAAEDTSRAIHAAHSQEGDGSDGFRGQCTVVQADVSKEEVVQALMQFIRTSYGRLDYCVNNAGIEGTRAAVQDYPTDVFDKVMAVNVRGVFLCLKHAIPLMLETARGHGAIVITSSTAGVSGMPEFSAYSASKHAVVGLMRTAAAEVAPQGLRINCVNPATTDTPMVARFAAQWPEWQAATNASYPIGRIATAQEVAEAVVWMCTKATFMTGQTLVLDGGASCS